MRLRAVILSLVVALAACSQVAQSTAPGAAFPAALSFENRGGPAFTIKIGTSIMATVACNSGATLTPGQAGVPALPWDFKVIRVRDGSVLVDLRVTELPRAAEDSRHSRSLGHRGRVVRQRPDHLTSR